MVADHTLTILLTSVFLLVRGSLVSAEEDAGT